VDGSLSRVQDQVFQANVDQYARRWESDVVIVDVVILFAGSLLSMLMFPDRQEHRSWRAELLFRFIKALFDRSKHKSIAWLRQRQQALKLPLPKNKVSFETETVAGVSCLWCRPQAALNISTVLVYFHGGGYVFGSVDTHRNVLTELALLADAWVVGVDYRLGPEHPFPAAQDDCLLVSQTILERYSGQKVVLAGDSAGGGLALASFQNLLEDKQCPRPAALVLISPWIDPANRSSSMTINESCDLLDSELLDRWLNIYLPDNNPVHRRINFSQMDCRELVPVYIQAASDEVFIDQIRAFYQRADSAGVSIRLDEYPGLFHVFQILSPLLPEARQALDEVGYYIKNL